MEDMDYDNFFSLKFFDCLTIYELPKVDIQTKYLGGEISTLRCPIPDNSFVLRFVQKIYLKNQRL